MLSLQTRRYREAEHRAALVDCAFASAWERAVTTATSDADLKRILRDFLREALAEDLRHRLETPPGRPAFDLSWDGSSHPLEADLAGIDELADLHQEALAERNTEFVRPEVNPQIERD